jgi:hypothetical protein
MISVLCTLYLFKKNLRETSKLGIKETTKILEDEKDNITNATKKMYTDYSSRDDLKTLKSLKSDSTEVVYEAIYLEKGEDEKKENDEEEENDEDEEAEENEEDDESESDE